MPDSLKPARDHAASTHALRSESDERLRLLVDQIAQYAIFLLDTQGLVVSWNAGAKRIKGYDADEIIGQHFSKFYRPEDAWKCQRALDTATRDGRYEDEGPRLRKDGSTFWANVVITAVREASGALVGFAKVTRDMTERRRAEEELRQSEERFRLLVESVKDYAIFMLDPSGAVATWNVGAARIKGYKSDEIIGKHFSVFYSEEEVRSGKCEMELRVAADEGRFEDEGFRIRKDGTRFWANVVITALRDASGRLVGFAKVTRDLTERRAAELLRLRQGTIARERIHALAELSAALADSASVEDVARTAVDGGTSFPEADSAAFYVRDPESETLLLVAERGCNAELVEQSRLIDKSSDNPLYAVGIGQNEGVWIDGPEAYADFFPSFARLRTEGKRASAFACVPLLAEGRSLGMFSVGFYERHQFSNEDREFLLTFARQCAQALARARRVGKEREAATLAARLQASVSTTLRSIGDAVIATDAGSRISLMNGAAEDLCGVRENEARGRLLEQVFKIVDEQTLLPVPNPVAEILRTGSNADLTNSLLVTKAGPGVHVESSGAPIRGDDGNVEGVVLVFRDVSERHSRETRGAFLAEATSTLAQSLDSEETVARVARLSVPVFADYCCVDLLSETGTQPRHLCAAHRDPERLAAMQALYANCPPWGSARTGVSSVLRGGRPEFHAQLSAERAAELLVGSDASAEHLAAARELGLQSAMVVPLTASGRLVGAMSFAFAESGRRFAPEDVSFAENLAARCANSIENSRLYLAELRARRQADQAARSKDEFLAVVSHELRTPLNAIMGWSKLLGAKEFDEQRRRGAIETIERNAVAMAQLIEDLLDMSRVVSGKLRLQTERVDVKRIVEAALESIRPAAAAREIRLEAALGASREVSGDPSRLQQIVWNLLSNAVKFTPKGGHVAAALGGSDSTVEIRVSDNGRGIAPAFLAHVFEAFRQEDASSTRSQGGLGLGLAITKQLVELHGGRIEAASAGEGRGATFTVTLPISAIATKQVLQAEDGREFKMDSAFERPTDLVDLRVLVVDDDDDARRLISAILEDCGCVVSTASGVSEAMTRFTESIPDVLLSDIGMPHEDGFGLIARVRALPADKGGNVPAAAVTAYTRPEDRRKMLNAGYSLHLAKPVEPAELVTVISTLRRFAVRRS